MEIKTAGHERRFNTVIFMKEEKSMKKKILSAALLSVLVSSAFGTRPQVPCTRWTKLPSRQTGKGMWRRFRRTCESDG
ncbi:MAG: hypothetical protein ACLUIQ_05565 [Dialister invisus]